MTKLQIIPISLKEANKFIKTHHRHHGPVIGYKFALGVIDEFTNLCGTTIIGRPISRHQDEGITAEVRRLCTDGSLNACSMLYSAAWRVAKNMGYKKMITYILDEEPGTSLKASNWHFDGIVKERSWSHHSRLGFDKHPLCNKQRWIIT